MLPVAPSQNALALPADTLFQLTESIWNLLLEMNIQRATAAPIDVLEGEAVLTGRVVIRGDWQGSVILVCPKTLARQAAAAMFKTALADISDPELRDAIGELTHVLGGNLKSLLPTPCHLSPPAVVEGYNTLIEGPIVERILLHCEGQPLQIILSEWEKTS